jgi:integrase
MSYTGRPQQDNGSLQDDSRKLRWPEDALDQNDSEDATRLVSAADPQLLLQKPPEPAACHEVLSRVGRELLAEPRGMTIKDFVERVFVPEHVAMKTLSGKLHYQAMLKHVLTPEDVDRMFQAGAETPKTKLTVVPDWPYLGSALLSDTRSEDVQRIVSAALMHGYSTQTATHIRNAISSIFEHAIKGRWVTGPNPARWTARPEVIHKEAHALTLIQTRYVLEKMQYPEKEMILMALITGMKMAEICGLQWKFVNLTSNSCNAGYGPIPPRTIAARKRWYKGELSGVNGKRCRARDLPIPDPLLPVLLGLRGRADFTGPDDFVLVSRDGKPINEAKIRLRRLRPIGDELQMPWLSWHVFGRTRMNLLYEFGIKFQELIISPPVKPPQNVTVPNVAAWARAFGRKWFQGFVLSSGVSSTGQPPKADRP